MTMIIIEGPDGSGKTTLVNTFRQLTDQQLCIVRRAGPPKSVKEIWDFIGWVIGCPDGLNLVLDRFPIISEKIYGPVLRGHDRLQNYSRQDIVNILKNYVQMTVIYCRPQVARIAVNVGKNEQLFGVQSQLNQIIEMYDAWMYAFRQAGIKVIDYDYELHNPQILLNKVLSK